MSRRTTTISIIVALCLTFGARTQFADEPTYAWTGMAVRWAPGAEGIFVVVDRVTPEGPAARAGILPGDILERIDGRPMRELDELDFILYLSARTPGSRCVVTLIRAGKTRQHTIVLGRMPSRLVARWKAGLAQARAVREMRTGKQSESH
jgi:C-terminal processing protease CtpA/Prc